MSKCNLCNGKGKYFHQLEKEWYDCPSCTGEGFGDGDKHYD